MRLTVIPSDKLIILDGVPLYFDYVSQEGIHAIQWYDTKGEIEWDDDLKANTLINQEDYDTYIKSFVDLYNNEKIRLEKLEEEYYRSQNTPEKVYERKYEEINTKCQEYLTSLTNTYPDRELLTFDKQEKEARAYLADPKTSCPHISAIAEGRGLTVEELAKKIVRKADLFSIASGSLIGQRQKYEDMLEKFGKNATVEEIESINVVYILPESIKVNE